MLAEVGREVCEKERGEEGWDWEQFTSLLKYH